MTALVSPWPGPPLFHGLYKGKPLPPDMCQGYSIQTISVEMTPDKQSLCGSTGELNSLYKFSQFYFLILIFLGFSV